MMAMRFSRTWFASTAMVSLGNFAAALLTLLRNVLIARMISVDDFGIASTFAIAVTLIESGTNIGLDRIAVQDRRGGHHRFIAQLHGIQVLRGIIGAGLVLIFAQTYANVMDLGEHGETFQYLALIPLVRGFTNLGMFKAQRVAQFGPFVAATIASNLSAVVIAVPAALWLQDFRAMLTAILVQQLLLMLLSHFVRCGRYRVQWNTKVFCDSLRFGLPLLVNGLVLFAILGGDQLLAGSFLGMKTLGWFAVAFSLTLVPATVLSTTLQSLYLPRLARLHADTLVFAERSRAVLQVTFVTSAAMVLALFLIGPIAVDLLFGPKYESAAAILPWLAVLQGLRVAKAGPAIVSIASAQTTDPLIANFVRLLFLPVAIVWLSAGGETMSIVSTAIIGEIVALLTALSLLVRRGVLLVPRNIQIARHG